MEVALEAPAQRNNGRFLDTLNLSVTITVLVFAYSV